MKSPIWIRKFQLQEKREAPLKWKTLVILIGFQLLNKYTIGPFIGPHFAKILNQRIQFGPLPSGTFLCTEIAYRNLVNFVHTLFSCSVAETVYFHLHPRRCLFLLCSPFDSWSKMVLQMGSLSSSWMDRTRCNIGILHASNWVDFGQYDIGLCWTCYYWSTRCRRFQLLLLYFHQRNMGSRSLCQIVTRPWSTGSV